VHNGNQHGQAATDRDAPLGHCLLRWEGGGGLVRQGVIVLDLYVPHMSGGVRALHSVLTIWAHAKLRCLS